MCRIRSLPLPVLPLLPAPCFITSPTIFMAFLRASAPVLIQPAQLALEGSLQLPELQKAGKKAGKSPKPSAQSSSSSFGRLNHEEAAFVE